MSQVHHERNSPPKTFDLVAPIESYSVSSWSPAPYDERGQAGKPTQVHLVINIAEVKISLMQRFKSQRAINELIDALIEHRDHVWPSERTGR